MLGCELLPLIKAEDRHDKFSLNLIQWVKKHRKIPLFVAYSPISCLDGKPLGIFDGSKTLAHQIYIGFGALDDGYLHGARLSEILCNGSKTKEWAYPPRHLFEVLPNWWEGYIHSGKCFIDPEHRLYSDRWKVSADGEMRECIWCRDFVQHRKIEMVEKVSWVDAM